MMAYPDKNPDKVSGFEGQTALKQGIPTKIPTKCRDWRLQISSKRESRHHVAIAGKRSLGLDFLLKRKPSGGLPVFPNH